MTVIFCTFAIVEQEGYSQIFEIFCCLGRFVVYLYVAVLS